MKLLNLKLESCERCPYSQFQDSRTMQAESGWYCQHPSGYFRILTEVEFHMERKFPELPVRCPLPEFKDDHVAEAKAVGKN